jgi:hypothetical protein
VQVKYAANLGSDNTNDSVFDLVNDNASGKNICVSVYTFSSDEQLVSCCSCEITPNQVQSLTARKDLINNVLTPSAPSSITVKLIAAAVNTDQRSGAPKACNAANGAYDTATRPGGDVIVNGLLAWGTVNHKTPTAGVYSTTETPFGGAVYNAADHNRIADLCGFIQSNGSGFGVCTSCKAGAQGAAKK